LFFGQFSIGKSKLAGKKLNPGLFDFLSIFILFGEPVGRAWCIDPDFRAKVIVG
jgi:hypothetical protein